jgi:hypothetical protein
LKKVLEGDDRSELFFEDAAQDFLRYPVIKVRLRVGVTEPLG